LEADVALRGASWLADTRETVASHDLTIVDDPRRGRGAWRIDDEGVEARPIALLRRGCVDSWIHDLRSSTASGRPATGHGRRASFRDPVQPRMGCTFVGAGRSHPSEALEGVADGVYVRRMEAASTDPKTGRSVFTITDADRIRSGRLDSPLLPFLMFAEGPTVLAGLERIADDVAFDTCVGSCVRDGQPLAVSVGGPTFRVSATMVGP
jgi:TldD protein